MLVKKKKKKAKSDYMGIKDKKGRGGADYDNLVFVAAANAIRVLILFEGGGRYFTERRMALMTYGVKRGRELTRVCPGAGQKRRQTAPGNCLMINSVEAAFLRVFVPVSRDNSQLLFMPTFAPEPTPNKQGVAYVA